MPIISAFTLLILSLEGIFWHCIILRQLLLELWNATLKHVVFKTLYWGYEDVPLLHVSKYMFIFCPSTQKKSRDFTNIGLHERRQLAKRHKVSNPVRGRLGVPLSPLIFQRLHSNFKKSWIFPQKILIKVSYCQKKNL